MVVDTRKSAYRYPPPLSADLPNKMFRNRSPCDGRPVGRRAQNSRHCFGPGGGGWAGGVLQNKVAFCWNGSSLTLSVVVLVVRVADRERRTVPIEAGDGEVRETLQFTSDLIGTLGCQWSHLRYRQD